MAGVPLFAGFGGLGGSGVGQVHQAWEAQVSHVREYRERALHTGAVARGAGAQFGCLSVEEAGCLCGCANCGFAVVHGKVIDAQVGDELGRERGDDAVDLSLARAATQSQVSNSMEHGGRKLRGCEAIRLSAAHESQIQYLNFVAQGQSFHQTAVGIDRVAEPFFDALFCGKERPLQSADVLREPWLGQDSAHECDLATVQVAVCAVDRAVWVRCCMEVSRPVLHRGLEGGAVVDAEVDVGEANNLCGITKSAAGAAQFAELLRSGKNADLVDQLGG